MALSDLAVFSEYAYDSMTEVLDQQIGLFNAASAGTISLSTNAQVGDFSERAFYAKIGGLVRRRDAYGSGAIPSKKLTHLVDNMVKIAAGTAPVELDPGQFKWIQKNPQEAGAAMGQQLAVDSMADMLNTSLGACSAALSTVAALNKDISADAVSTLNARALNRAAGLFGDSSQEIAVWCAHSAPLVDFHDTALVNAERLFTYGSVNVMTDPFGRRFIISDSPGLMEVGAGGAIKYTTLGLSSSAIVIQQNGDFTENMQTTNGEENIKRSYQAEWSFNLGIKGFAWNKATGGKSPDDAAIMAGANWAKIVSSVKDAAGVRVISD